MLPPPAGGAVGGLGMSISLLQQIEATVSKIVERGGSADGDRGDPCLRHRPLYPTL